MNNIKELYFKLLYVGADKIENQQQRITHILITHTYFVSSFTFLILWIQSFVFNLFDIGMLQLGAFLFTLFGYFYQKKNKYSLILINTYFALLIIILFAYDVLYNILEVNFVYLGVIIITKILVLFRLHKVSAAVLILTLLSSQVFAFFFEFGISPFQLDPQYSNILFITNLLITAVLFITIMSIFVSLWQLSENELESKIAEKEVLLAEVNHRVRNNLNVIISLMKLQQANMESEEVYEALEESKLRVYSMASVHNKLYANKDLNNIALSEYVEDLAKDLQFSSNPNVDISIHSGNISLNVDKAIPLGLILNELFTNSFKHAFPNKISGKINLEIEQYGHTLNVAYKDNGKNFTMENLRRNPNSLGVTLIESLSDQLDGKLNISEEKGFKFNLNFPYLV